MNPLIFAWIRLTLYVTVAGLFAYVALAQRGIKRWKNATMAIYFLCLVFALGGRVFVNVALQTFIADWIITPFLAFMVIALVVDLIYTSRLWGRRKTDRRDPLD
jgi:phosphatidylglycerophosphate synthase